MELGSRGQPGVRAMCLVAEVGPLGQENATSLNITGIHVLDLPMIGKHVIPTIVQVRVLYRKID